MRDKKEAKRLAREKLQQIDQRTISNLQSRANQYSGRQLTPENFASFTNALDEGTLQQLIKELGVNVDPNVVRNLTPQQIQQLMELMND
ncbi:MAG: hypothetical protein GX030_00435 [Firmicutes bacterium]|nr:hypothetical protein [Bacillota bacterium]